MGNDQLRWDAGEFLTKVVDIVPNLIYVFNQKTQSNEYTNRGLGEAMGYTSEELVAMGSDFVTTVFHPDDLPAVFANMAKIREMPDGELSHIEYRVKHRNGRWVWLLSIDTVFERDADGSVISHIGVATDITLQKEAEARLQAINEELEQKVAERTAELRALNEELEARVVARTAELQRNNEELEELAYVATHDLKAPLNNINSLLGILEEDGMVEDAEGQSIIKMMHTACETGQSKINALVQVAQARGEGLPETTELTFDAALAAARDILGQQITERHAEISADFSEAPTVKYSSVHLQSLFENLLSNAIKYTAPAETPQISIRSWRVDGQVKLSVADKGIGIDLDRDQSKIFGLFKRAHKNIPGSGIGLYMVRQSLSRLGGGIEVESAPGEGARFTITFGES
ncbi:MAG: sensor histidine kinase [Bradymonadia bacterium]